MQVIRSVVAAPRTITNFGRADRARIRAALQGIPKAEQRLRAAGSNLLKATLAGARIRAYDHYPEDDVRDYRTHSQFFFHAHPDRTGEAGHFHLFMRKAAVPAAMRRRRVPVVSPAGQDGTGMVHLGAISLDRRGVPIRLFTTNLWVTGGDFYFAEDTLRLLERFVVTVRKPSSAVNAWVSAMVCAFHGHFALLLERRDQVMAAWAQRHPKSNVFETRRLEITSVMRIDIAQQLALMAQAVNRPGD